MGNQPGLFGAELPPAQHAAPSAPAASPAVSGEAVDDRIERDFRKFHAENPHVYELLCVKAREAKAAGHARYGIKSIFERVRWHYQIELRHLEEPFKLNNNYTSRYARLIMAQEPDLAGFFEIRELVALVY